MNREEEDLQFLGFNGVYTESIKLLVITSSKVFTETALSLALPLSFLMCSFVLSSKIIATAAANDSLFTAMFSERAVYFLVKAAYFTILLVFGLVYTSVFSSTEDLTVKQMTGIIPKLWKHLTSAFLWTFAIVFIYNVLASFFFVIWAVFFRGGETEKAVLVLILLFYLMGLVKISSSLRSHMINVLYYLIILYGVSME